MNISIITFIVDDWVEETVGMEKYRDISGIDDSLYTRYHASNLGNAYE